MVDQTTLLREQQARQREAQQRSQIQQQRDARRREAEAKKAVQSVTTTQETTTSVTPDKAQQEVGEAQRYLQLLNKYSRSGGSALRGLSAKDREFVLKLRELRGQRSKDPRGIYRELVKRFPNASKKYDLNQLVNEGLVTEFSRSTRYKGQEPGQLIKVTQRDKQGIKTKETTVVKSRYLAGSPQSISKKIYQKKEQAITEPVKTSMFDPVPVTLPEDTGIRPTKTVNLYKSAPKITPVTVTGEKIKYYGTVEAGTDSKFTQFLKKEKLPIPVIDKEIDLKGGGRYLSETIDFAKETGKFGYELATLNPKASEKIVQAGVGIGSAGVAVYKKPQILKNLATGFGETAYREPVYTTLSASEVLIGSEGFRLGRKAAIESSDYILSKNPLLKKPTDDLVDINGEVKKVKTITLNDPKIDKLVIGGVKTFEEPLAIQAERAGKEAVITTAYANRIVGPIKRKQIVRKPIPGESGLTKETKDLLKKFDEGTIEKPEFFELQKNLRKETVSPIQPKGVDLLERSIYGDPDKGLRVSRLNLDAPDESTSIFRLLIKDPTQKEEAIKFGFPKRSKPEVGIMVETIEDLPKNAEFDRILKKFNEGKPLSDKELNILTEWQITPSGKAKLFGSTTFKGGKEREVTFAPKEFVRREKKIGTALFGRRRVPIVKTELVKPDKELKISMATEELSELTQPIKLKYQDVDFDINKVEIFKDEAGKAIPQGNIKQEINFFTDNAPSGKFPSVTKEKNLFKESKKANAFDEFLKTPKRRGREAAKRVDIRGIGTGVLPKINRGLNKISRRDNLLNRRNSSASRITSGTRKFDVTRKSTPGRVPQFGIRKTNVPRITNPVRKITTTTTAPPSGSPFKTTPNTFTIKLPRGKDPTKPKKQDNTPYDLFVRDKGVYKKVEDNIRYKQALATGSYLSDNTTSARFKLKKSTGPLKEPKFKIPTNYWAFHQGKFRDYKIRKGKRLPLQRTLIEKKNKRIDTLGEKKQLSLAKAIRGLI